MFKKESVIFYSKIIMNQCLKLDITFYKQLLFGL